ncbi:uncharacterized protein BJ171DRAFT_7137 [Polychytrium aggregatum]|uniref:uncharacterized protein n=1 Tax=Polychytrium aggregatum TaxID=110093 RepID=UPI0022FE3C84|nr:uncharacterized protein BJ171DRAFT_7137 [Polychytrium aggregatum]KAI9209762.1 hypothetical protein BJ171DRAFT_7137 [Polychytrium aggregatum]
MALWNHDAAADLLASAIKLILFDQGLIGMPFDKLVPASAPRVVSNPSGSPRQAKVIKRLVEASADLFEAMESALAALGQTELDQVVVLVHLGSTLMTPKLLLEFRLDCSKSSPLAEPGRLSDTVHRSFLRSLAVSMVSLDRPKSSLSHLRVLVLVPRDVTLPPGFLPKQQFSLGKARQQAKAVLVHDFPHADGGPDPSLWMEGSARWVWVECIHILQAIQ